MKKITITVDDTTLMSLELLRYYFSSNSSALVRRAVGDLEASVRGTCGYDRAVTMYREHHPDCRGSGA